LLIKNMLYYRAKGWDKTKKQDESGPMKVDELREKLEKKLKDEMAQRELAEQEEQQYLGGGGRRGDDRSGYKKQGTYQERGGRGGKDRRDDRGGRDDRRGGEDKRGQRIEKQLSQ